MVNIEKHFCPAKIFNKYTPEAVRKTEMMDVVMSKHDLFEEEPAITINENTPNDKPNETPSNDKPNETPTNDKLNKTIV